jgi:hypothetical protein
MYCPICGAEYRPTFTVCSDCQANLVPDPPSKPLEDAPPVDGPFVLVWSGTDPRRHAEVRELLERENIPEHTVRREDRLVNPTIHPAFEVYVPAVLKPRAKAALNEPNFGKKKRSRPLSPAYSKSLLKTITKMRMTIIGIWRIGIQRTRLWKSGLAKVLIWRT